MAGDFMYGLERTCCVRSGTTQSLFFNVLDLNTSYHIAMSVGTNAYLFILMEL